MQSLQTAITRTLCIPTRGTTPRRTMPPLPAPAEPAPANFPTNRQADKLATLAPPPCIRPRSPPTPVPAPPPHLRPPYPNPPHQPVPAASFLPTRGTYPRNPCRLPLSSLPAEPAPCSSAARLPALIALCNECTMQSLHSAITTPPALETTAERGQDVPPLATPRFLLLTRRVNQKPARRTTSSATRSPAEPARTRTPHHSHLNPTLHARRLTPPVDCSAARPGARSPIPCSTPPSPPRSHLFPLTRG